MQPFHLSLSNNGTVAGRHSIPPPSDSPIRSRPLIVALHGGNYDNQYFDATPEYSASFTSATFQVPFVAIDRPSYGGTSSVLPIPEGSGFTQESGLLLHREILPKLWTEFGVTNDCNCLVLMCHSLGVMSGTVAAALHAQDESPRYPLGGLIASGMGNTQSDFMKNNAPSFTVLNDDYIAMPAEVKDTIMFKPGTAAPEVLAQCERLNAPTPLAEISTFVTEWMAVWKKKWAAEISAPVMFSLVEDDPFFVTTEEEMGVCLRAFGKSSRVDGSLIRGAPHCVELSYWSRGWYARCFGFALECAASFTK